MTGNEILKYDSQRKQKVSKTEKVWTSKSKAKTILICCNVAPNQSQPSMVPLIFSTVTTAH
jgi:hypothetical protein